MILFRDRATTILFDVLSTIDNGIKFLLPINICPIVPDTFVKSDIKFEFIDIDSKTLCMDQDLAIKAINNDSSIGGLLFVNTYGVKTDSESFYKKIKEIKPEIFIIDDKCLCVQNFDFDINESYSSLTLFSSGYSKYVDIGYGGFGYLKEENFGDIFEDNSTGIDFLDYKAMLTEKIPIMREHKAKINTIYREGIPTALHLGREFEDWRFSILINDKEVLLKDIFEEGFFASSHYEAIDYKYVKDPMTNSNARVVASRVVNLFNDHRFDENMAERVVTIINKFKNKHAY